MANVTAPAQMTAEEFFDWMLRPENAGVRYELVKGVPTLCPLATDTEPYWSVANVLQRYVLTRRGASMALRGDGVIVGRNPDTVLTPDLMVFLKPCPDEWPKRYTDEVPDLVIEIMPQSISYSRQIQRGERYLRGGGARMLWWIDTEERGVFVCRLKASIQFVESVEILTGNGVLPDFACKVADLFALPGAPPEPTP